MGVPVNSKLSERLAVVAASLPTNTTTGGGTLTSAAVNIATTSGDFFSRILGIAAVNSSNPSTVTIIKASDSAMTSATAILTQTVASTTVPIVLFDVNNFTQALNDTLNTYLAIKIVSTVNAATNFFGTLIAGDGRYEPAFTYNATSVNATINAVT